MPKVTEEYRATKRDEIAAAAMRAFARKGFQAASMADIIAESGLSAGAIYGHYKGKSEIVLHVAAKVIGDRIGEVDELAARDPMPPPGTLVRVVTEGMVRDVGTPGLLVQLWGEAVTEPGVRELSSLVVGRLRELFRAYISLWQQREHGLSVEDADQLADEQAVIFVSCTQGYLLQTAIVQNFDREAFLRSAELHLPR